MALSLVERLVSADRAREVQRYIQYDHGPYPQPLAAGMPS